MGVVADVYTHLIAQGIADGSTGWDVVRRHLADAPKKDQLIVLTEDGGPPPEIKETVGIGDSALEDAGLLVTVRANAWDSDASLSKAQEIFTELHGKRNIQLDATTYMRIRAQTPESLFIGFDEQGRPRHTISFLFLREF